MRFVKKLKSWKRAPEAATVAAVGVFWLVVLMVCIGAAGCNGVGPIIELPEGAEAIMAMLVQEMGMVEPGGAEDVSPTCPHYNPDMLMVHRATMRGVRPTARVLFGEDGLARLEEFAASTEGATALLAVATGYCCPIAKGTLRYLGEWAIYEVPNPNPGMQHPLYRIEHEDGRMLGPPDPNQPQPIDGEEASAGGAPP